MAGHRARHVRPPAVAGRFYPGDPEACRAAAQQYIRTTEEREDREVAGVAGEPAAMGAIVPHAGWICSGAIAGEGIGALRRSAGDDVDLVVVFGAVHTPVRVEYAALDRQHDAWEVPGEVIESADEVAAALQERRPALFADDERLHRREHAVEVELPLVRAAWPAARLLAIETPAASDAAKMGIEVARACDASGLKAVFLASSDLTHYGPDYDFTPAGVGAQGLEWAKENDRRLLRIVTEMRAEAVVPEARARFNACGGGAIAAMLAAARELGARSATVLRHANSYETLSSLPAGEVPFEIEPDNAVGYAAVVVR